MNDAALTHAMLPSLEALEDITYCINGVDSGNDVAGTFAYDEDLYNWGYGMWAISPIFEDVIDFYAWAKEQGFRYHDLTRMFTLSRTFI